MSERGADIDPMRVPANKPVFLGVVVDDEGYLWVRTWPAAGETGARFDIFDPGGRYLGAVVASLGVTQSPLPVITDGMMWAHVIDDLDVSYVAGLRIDGR